LLENAHVPAADGRLKRGVLRGLRLEPLSLNRWVGSGSVDQFEHVLLGGGGLDRSGRHQGTAFQQLQHRAQPAHSSDTTAPRAHRGLISTSSSP
jgi:hypothetical protein